MKSVRRGWIPLIIAGAIVMSLALLTSPGSETAARQSTVPKTPNAERLVIHYSDGEYELLSRIPLVKTLPPSVSLPAPLGDVRGSWFEVVDRANTAIYRRLTTSPRIQWVEYLDPDGSGQLVREERIVEEQTFSVLVPLQDSARELVFFDSVGDGLKRQTVAASETGRVVLR